MVGIRGEETRQPLQGCRRQRCSVPPPLESLQLQPGHEAEDTPPRAGRSWACLAMRQKACPSVPIQTRFPFHISQVSRWSRHVFPGKIAILGPPRERKGARVDALDPPPAAPTPGTPNMLDLQKQMKTLCFLRFLRPGRLRKVLADAVRRVGTVGGQNVADCWTSKNQ